MMKRTVLIVDDEAVNRRILGKLLQDQYTIIEAADGKEALALLAANADLVSAVLLDIVMPGMDGYAVLRAMSQNPELSKIPVIVSSQRDGEEAEIRALSLGAQDFIAKPYKAEIVRRRLSNLINFRETAALINKVERDELTGLYNKQFFMKNVSDWLHQHPEEQFDLMCIGIERFRLINERFGTDRGDELLCHIARLLNTASRPIFAARFTDDLFYLLVPHRDTYDAEVLKSWYQKVNDFSPDMDIKMHCGIYAIEDTETPVNTMCDRAQLASEKNKGSYDAPFCLYDTSLRQKLMDEQFITGNMQSALRSGQFHVYYQPKYDLNNELIAGAEALVRWIHPQRGMISPGTFIPILERSGLISELDLYVWETACRDISRWMQQGLSPIAVSINVSRADIYNPHLSEILLELLKKYQVPIQYLHLEITESAYTDNPGQIIAEVGKLRRLGFIVEMDDFGSGYSSLNMLAEMPVDVLKLDMRFIQAETARTSGKGILSFVISLGKWLDLAVIAEGVETGDQISMLRSMDCNYVQGFYYAKPMNQEDFTALLKSSHTTEMICSSQTAHRYLKEKATPPSPVSGRTMLIVDDLEFNRAVLSANFSTDFSVVEKGDGSEAWDYLDQHFAEVDIIMLDLLMPVMDGFQLLHKIRSDSRMSDMPVIITSQGDATSERRALQMQADDFISKPYHPEIIRHRVNNVLASHRLHQLQKAFSAGDSSYTNLSDAEQALLEVRALRRHFDIVRLVDPGQTLVYDDASPHKCELNACYSVWGKASRCANCISLKALADKGRHCKLERSENGLYFIISEYVPSGESGAVIEMVTKLDDADTSELLAQAKSSAKPDSAG